MAWQQTVNIWDPIDVKSSQWKAGMAGREVGQEMEKARDQMYANSGGPDPFQEGERQQQQNENDLLRREQERREFDSATARMAQGQKMSVLSGLLGGGRGMSGMQGRYRF